MKNKIEDLRNHLFEQLERLRESDDPKEIERAKAVADVGRVLVDTAKAEIAFIATTGKSQGTGFIALPEEVPTRPQLAAGARR